MRTHRSVRFLLVLVSLAMLSGVFGGRYAFADTHTRWIEGTLSSELSLIIHDDIRDRIYLADSGNKQVVVIDFATEKVIKKLPMPGKITDMAFRKDNNLLAVASNGGIVTIELNTFSVKKLLLPVGIQGTVKSIAFDRLGRILCVPQKGWISLLSANGETILKQFGVSVFASLDTPVTNGLLKTDPTGTSLYVGFANNLSLPPRERDVLCKINITDGLKPVWVAMSNEVAGNFGDFIISPRYKAIYILSLSKSASDAYSSVLDTDKLQPTSDGNFLGFPMQMRGIDVSRAGEKIYVLATQIYEGDPIQRQSFVYIYDADNHGVSGYIRLSEASPSLDTKLRGLAVDRLRRKAFAIYGLNTVRVQVVDLPTDMSCN